MSAASVEIVVARYDEDVAWLNTHAREGVRFSVFNKGSGTEAL